MEMIAKTLLTFFEDEKSTEVEEAFAQSKKQNDFLENFFSLFACWN